MDATQYAVRRDLAEIELADTVFAQHYAVPLAMTANREVPIHSAPRADSDVVATLAIDQTFNILDIGKDWAWGRGDTAGTVGYVAADALNRA
ncbi:MAG: SH3 domain-containing protein [Pseudomonadota bacterium]